MSRRGDSAVLRGAAGLLQWACRAAFLDGSGLRFQDSQQLSKPVVLCCNPTQPRASHLPARHPRSGQGSKYHRSGGDERGEAKMHRDAIHPSACLIHIASGPPSAASRIISWLVSEAAPSRGGNCAGGRLVPHWESHISAQLRLRGVGWRGLQVPVGAAQPHGLQPMCRAELSSMAQIHPPQSSPLPQPGALSPGLSSFKSL